MNVQNKTHLFGLHNDSLRMVAARTNTVSPNTKRPSKEMTPIHCTHLFWYLRSWGSQTLNQKHLVFLKEPSRSDPVHAWVAVCGAQSGQCSSCFRRTQVGLASMRKLKDCFVLRLWLAYCNSKMVELAACIKYSYWNPSRLYYPTSVWLLLSLLNRFWLWHLM